MKVTILCFACLLCTAVFGCQDRAAGSAYFKFIKSNVQVNFEKSENSVECVVRRGVQVVQRIKLDRTFQNNIAQRNGDVITLSGTGKTLKFEIVKDEIAFSLIKVSRDITEKTRTETDCVKLEIGQTNWFGGPENRYQYWPVEKASFADYSFVTKETDNCAIAERYWLNSKGAFLFVNESSPLFIDQNTDEHPNQLCLSVKFALPYDRLAPKYEFSYYIGVAADAKQAHLKALEYGIFKKPTGHPDETMVRYPIWSTWAEYKAAINHSIVTEFSDKILKHNFTHSQLEIDDKWETCYGSTIFDDSDNKFPNIKEYLENLKAQGFRITLWIHPFINEECDEHADAKENGYLVQNRDGNTTTTWWVEDGHAKAGYVDFTNPQAAAWFKQKLQNLRALGIDGFKFDAGESSWSPSNTVFNGKTLADPSDIVRAYIRTVASFGGITEVRSGQGTQDLNVFLRMIDKDTEWGWNNGLKTLITTLLQFNMVGYSFVLPDMIGGNGYNDSPPDYEIFVRWLQANVFMPSIQYSYVPWDFETVENVSVVEICRKFTELHSGWVSDEIIKRFKKAVETGEPVNPPLWWIAPRDPVAFQIYDQFLLGDNYIVAPVIEKGQTRRDIYLPEGTWQDGNSEKVYHGPRWVMDYEAPLDVLPYFKRVSA